MLYVQFFQLSTGYIEGTIPPQFGDKKLIPVCGTDGVAGLDARRTNTNNRALAHEECVRRGYIGYQLYKGRTLTDSVAVTRLTDTRTAGTKSC